MKKGTKHYLEVSSSDLQIMFEGLMNWRNRLIGEEHPVEPIDDMLVKIMNLI